MREPLLFACPNKSSQNKRHPYRRRLRRAVRGEEQGFPGVAGMRPPAFGRSPTLRLVRFDPPKVASHSFAAGRPCSASRGDTPMLAATGCGQNSRRFVDAQTGWPYRRRAPDTRRRCASPSPQTGRNTNPSLSIASTSTCRGPYLYSGSLERSAEQWRSQEEKDSRVSEGRVAARVSRLSLLRPEPRRAPMRSIGAR